MQILAKSNVLQVLTQLRHLSWTSNSALKVLAEPFWPSSPLNSPLGKYVSLSIDSVSRQVQIHAVKVLDGVGEGQNNEIPCEVCIFYHWEFMCPPDRFYSLVRYVSSITGGSCALQTGSTPL